MKKDTIARKAAFDVLANVYKGQRLDFALEKLPQLDDADKSLARMIIMTVIRRDGELSAIIKQFVKNKIPKKKIEVILKIGLAQLIFMNIPEYAAVNSTVNLATTLHLAPYTALINGVLRSFQRQKDEITTNESYNLPSWLKIAIKDDLGREKMLSIAKSLMSVPSLYITVKENPQKWAEKLKGEVILGNSVKISSRKINDIEGYDNGAWWVQDLSAAIPATLFTKDITGKNVADFCAAPGGKTAQLITMGANVTAFDISEKRTEILKENITRLGMSAEIITNDASIYLENNPRQFDFILLDAPCSAVGTTRKNPDILLKESFVLPTKEQEKLLDIAYKSLKSGGEIVYSVCSFLYKEGAEQIEKFLIRYPEAKIVPVKNLPDEIIKNDFLHITPDFMMDKGGVDGFFAAIIKKP